MKETQVDQDGRVRCPKCGSTDFSDKRTGEAKLGAAGLGVVTFGVGGVLGAAAMPKRLKCRGCGENLKRGGGRYKPKKGMPGYVEQPKVSGPAKLAQAEDSLATARAEAARIKAEADAKVASGEPLKFGERTLAARMAERRARKAREQGGTADSQ